MPVPTPSPIRVAECGECGQLFALNASEGVVSCPACDAPAEVAALKVVDLRVAEPLDIRVEARPPAPALPVEPLDVTATTAPPIPTAAPTTPDPTDDPAPATDSEPPSAASPGVADWLLGDKPLAEPTPADPLSANTQPSAPEADPAASDAASSEPEAAPSLAESLGWSKADWRIGDVEDYAPPTSDQPSQRRTAEFDLNLAGTPLSERLDVTDDETPTEPNDVATPDADSGARSGWARPLGLAAAFLGVAGSVGYFVYASGDPDDLTASAQRERVSGIVQPEPTGEQPDVDDDSALDVTVDEPSESAIPSETTPSETAPATLDLAELDPPAAETDLVQPAGFVDDDVAAPLVATPITTDASPADVPSDENRFAALDAAAADLEANPPTPPTGSRYAQTPDPEPSAFDAALDEFGPLPSDPPTDAAAAPSVADQAAPAEDFVEQAASFEAPAAPAAAPSVRPLTVDPVASTPATEELGLVNAPTHTVDELLTAIQNGEPAARAFATGRLDDPSQVSQMGKSYAQLCRLAQVLTLYQPNAGDPGAITPELEATDLYRMLFREGQPRDDSRAIAAQWMGWTGRPHGGVFFAGTPGMPTNAGGLVRYEFQLGQETVTVVMKERISVTRMMNDLAMEVGVIGVIVEDPRRWLAGYEGDDQRVVWARKTVPLRRPAAP